MDRGEHLWFVVGADSAIGNELMRSCADAGISCIGTTRRHDSHTSATHLDLATDPSAWTIPQGIDVAFLCAAITSIDTCQRKPEETRRVNVEQTLSLARMLKERGAHVVFLSTNQVFDGSVTRQKSDAPTQSLTEYGCQKAAVEQELLSTGNATIARFTKVVGSEMKLLHTWAAALRRQEVIAPFEDMVMSPVPLRFAAEVLQRIGERKPGRIVQISGERDITYAEVARRLASRVGVSDALVRPVSIESAGINRAAAPRNTTLDTTNLAQLGLLAPSVWDTMDALFEGVIDD